MSKGSLKIDRVQLEVVINNDPARKALRKLEDDMKELRKEMKKVPEGSQEWNKMNERLKALKTQHDNVIGSIKIHGLSLKELTQRQKELNLIMRNMDPRLPQYKELEKQLQSINKRHFELRRASSATGSSISRLALKVNKYFKTATAIIGIIASIIIVLKKLTQRATELSDKLADVMKTTNLTSKEVRGLYEDLKTINTRSARNELLDLARIAGKLGITGRNNILGFVRAADKINVALSEDLGGDAEEAIRQVGKLVELFHVAKDFGLEQGMLKVGSAINALGAASTANEGYIIEFAKRMGGIGISANLTIDQILGLGATLDQLGQSSEVSSTALSKIFVNMFKDSSEYANIAGVSVEEFSKLLNEDANEAFIKFLEGLNGNNDGLEVMSKRLDDLGVDGSRGVGVLTTLSKKTALLREQQLLSNEEFKKGTSLTNEFNIKNETLAGTLSKIGKRWGEIFASTGIMDTIDSLVKKYANFIGVNKKQIDVISRERDEVNRLVFELSSANISEKRRVDILKQLEEIAPKITEGLTDENIELGKLVENLKAYNEEALQRILLASVDEKAAAKMLEIEKLNQKRAESFNVVSLAMMQTEQDLATSNRTVEEKFQEFENILKKSFERQKKIVEDNKELTGWDGRTYKAAQSKAEEEALWKIVHVRREIENFFKTSAQIEHEGEILAEYEKQREALLEILNIKSEKETTFGGGTEVTEETKKQLEEKKKLYDEYIQAINKIIDDNYLKTLSKEEQELLAVDRKYEELYAKAVAANQNTEDLQLMHAEELAAKQKEIEEKKLQELKKPQDDYHQAINKLIDDNYAKTLSKSQQELLAVDRKYEELYAKAVSANQNTENLQLMHAEEWAAKQKEIEEKTQQEIIKIKENYGLDVSQELLDIELAQLEAYYDQKLLSEEEFQAAKANIANKYAGITEQTAIEWENKRLQAEKEIAAAKIQIRENVTDIIIDLVGKESKIGTALFLFEKALAIAQIIKNAAATKVQINLNKDMIPPIIPPGLPNPAYLGAHAAAAAQTAAVQMNMIAGITEIAATAVPRFVRQYDTGKYDVIGESDGRKYRAKYEKGPVTAIFNEPTLIGGLGLVGERRPELVIDGPTLENIQMNAPEIIQSIYAMRVPQYQTGKYIPESNIQIREVRAQAPSSAGGGADKRTDVIISLLTELVSESKKPTRARVVYQDIEDVDFEIKEIKNFVSK